MALPTHIYHALDHHDLLEEAGFMLPYTILLEHGAVVSAFHTSVDHGCKKEYDLSQRVLTNGLGIEDELIEFVVEKDRHRMNSVASTFIETISKGTSAHIGGGKALNAEFLTPQQTHNVLWRGASETRPFNLDADVTKMMEEETAKKEKEAKEKQRRLRKTTYPGKAANEKLLKEREGLVHNDQPKRTGILQKMVGVDKNDRKGHVSTVRIKWRRTGPGEVDERYLDSNSTSQEYTIEQMENVNPAVSKTKYAYERGCTFEGPSLMSRNTTGALSEEKHVQVLRAAAFILHVVDDHNKRDILEADLLFRFHDSLDRLYFLYSPYMKFAGEVTNEPKPQFFIPRQYHTISHRMPRPRSAHTNEEDLLTDPRLRIVFSPQRCQQDKDSHRRRSPRNAGDWELGNTLQPRDEHSDGGGDGDDSKRTDITHRVNYDKVLRAIESSFPAPLPEHARAHIHKKKAPTTASEATVRRYKVSPTPHAAREHPVPNYEAIAKRQYSEVVSNTRSLLAVLEGRRPLDDRFAEHCQLTPSQKKFLKGEMNRVSTGIIGGSAKTTFAEDRGLPEWADPQSKKPSTTGGGKRMKKLQQRASTSLGHQRPSSVQGRSSSSLSHSRPMSRAKPPPPCESRDLFYISKVDKRKEDRQVFRQGSQFENYGRPDPLKRTSRSLVPPGGFKSANRVAKLREETEQMKRERRLHLRLHGHHRSETPLNRSQQDDTGADGRGDESDLELQDSRSDGFGSQSQQGSTPYGSMMQSVQSRTLEFPELSSFHLKNIPMFADDADGELGSDRGGAADILASSLASGLLSQRSGTSNTKMSGDLARIDAEADVANRGKAELSVEQRVDYVLALPLPEILNDKPNLREAAEAYQRSVRAAVDYLVGLAYHLNSFKLSRGEQHSPTRQRPGQGNGTEDAALLLFSVPMDMIGPVGKRLVQLLKSIRSFEQMNTEENISELQFLLMDTTRTKSSKGERGGSRGLKQQATTLDDSTYTTHTLRGANIVSIPTFAVKTHVANYELQSKFHGWMLTKLRAIYLERIEELKDEAETESKQEELNTPKSQGNQSDQGSVANAKEVDGDNNSSGSATPAYGSPAAEAL